MHIVENLKSTIRYPKTRKKMDESTAAHTRRMALFFLLIQEELQLKVNILHTLKIILVHDIAEAVTGDYDAAATAKDPKLQAKKERVEKAAMLKFKNMLSKKQGAELYALWQEYEHEKTLEGQVAKICDKLETNLQFALHIPDDTRKRDQEDKDLMGTYGNKKIYKVVQCKMVAKLIKQELKKAYKKKGRTWKKEYDI